MSEKNKVIIQFYDGELTKDVRDFSMYYYDNVIKKELNIDISPLFYIIDGKYGVSRNKDLYNRIIEQCITRKKDVIILTNQVVLLNVAEVWNGSYHQIYLYQSAKNDYMLLKNCTNKYLRLAHNIMRMYLAHTFYIEGNVKNNDSLDESQTYIVWPRNGEKCFYYKKLPNQDQKKE